MSCNLSEIPCAPGINMGGIKDIHILRWEDALEVPGCCGLDTPYISEPIQVKTGTGFITHHFRPGTMKYTFKVVRTPDGPQYTGEITGNIDKLRGQVGEEIAKTAPGLYILVTEDWNGEVRLHGSIDRPWRFEVEGDVGARKRDENRTIWRFTGSSDKPSCYMDPSNPIPHYTETIQPLSMKLGSYSSGVFNHLAGAEYLGGGSHSMRISGQVYEADGITPSPPAVGKEILFDVYYKDVNGSLTYRGEVTFNFTAPLVFGDPTPANNSQPSADPGGAWPDLEAYFEPGSGIDSSGTIQLDFAKGDWAVATGRTHIDAVGIYLIGRVRKAGVVSRPTGSNYPIRITGYDVAAITFMSGVHLFNDEELHLQLFPNISGWSITSLITWEIGNNTYQVASGGTMTDVTPDASGVGLTQVGIDTNYRLFLYFSDTYPEILLSCSVSFQVTHDVTGVVKTVEMNFYCYTPADSDNFGPAYVSLDASNPLIGANIPSNAVFITAPELTNPNSEFSNPRNQEVELDGSNIASNLPVGIQLVTIPLNQQSSAHEIRMTADNDAGETACSYESIFWANLILI